MSEGRVLFIDAHDSFSNNDISLLKSELSVSVETIKIDDGRFVLNDDAFCKYLSGFDAVVAGPGPGHPQNPSDVGLIGRLWNLPDDSLIPVLGICLGFQSLVLSLGGTVSRLREPRHGMVTPVLHCGRDIFDDTGEILATQYHSLQVRLGVDVDQADITTLWQPSRSCRELIPLAYDLSDKRNGPILMAARHCHKPFWGVQYHPESICTNGAGRKLVTNWWRSVLAWNRPNGKLRSSGESQSQFGNSQMSNIPLGFDESSSQQLQWTSFRSPCPLNMADIVELLRCDESTCEPILLESGLRNGNPVNAETGRFSIIGLPNVQSIHIRYSVSNGRLIVSTAGNLLATRKAPISDVFAFLENFVEGHRAVGGSENVPFWGGLIGFISYEAGLESIGLNAAGLPEGRPDVWFVFVERSVAMDHSTGTVYLQSTQNSDAVWLSSTLQRLQRFAHPPHSESGVRQHNEPRGNTVYSPDQKVYCDKVRSCQDHLRAGSSYELCLTDTTCIQSDLDPWPLYMRLRQLNPAPFGAYFNIFAVSPELPSTATNVSLISSSPERFLSWSRDGECQFRPIKGTVKKGSGVTRDVAEGILSSTKERAENLMIVDLIRHDLSGVKSARNVRVPKLMSVEEYSSVFQLVSVIEGEIEGSGVPVLAASLPPGSMTGAPKKRSCELLQEIEGGNPRGLYSGVFGYLDVGGGGDFSVVIRSAFKWNDGDWRIGAGGAVTALSQTEAEWQEMLAKRENVLRVFE